MLKKVCLVATSQDRENKQFQELELLLNTHYKLETTFHLFSEVIDEISEDTLVLLYLNDKQIKTFIKNHLYSSINLAILPTGQNPKTVSSYGISYDIHEALDDAINLQRETKIDILLCNGEPVFTNTIIGDVHGLNNINLEKKSLLLKAKEFYKHLGSIKFKEFTFITEKGKKIETASTGVMVLEHNVKYGHTNLINEEFSFHDGQLNAFILSPTSILSYIYFLFLVFFYSRFSLKNLPKSIGVIKTSKLAISSSKPMDFTVDGVLLSSKQIELQIIKDALNINLGRNIKQFELKEEQTEEEKETIKVQHLPKGEVKQALLNKTIPLFKKANEEDFKELFLGLKESAKTSSVFIVLMILSTLLATTGLFQSSAPVIIGAMILAPLMAPIISLAMGIVRGENYLITHSSKTLLYGILTALLFSSFYTSMMPLSELTQEMRGRINPNILDLMVALISGIAGAYANAKSEVAKSLAGVAIAVALVPPLSVTGIGIGWGDFNMIYSSFLLFITNLVGITLAASLTFLVLGYAPIHRAKKGIVYSFVILAMVSIPLIVSFSKLIKQNDILSQLNNKSYILNQKQIDISILDVDLSGDIPLLFIQTQSEDVLNKNDLKILKQKLSTQMDDEIRLNVSMKTIVK